MKSQHLLLTVAALLLTGAAGLKSQESSDENADVELDQMESRLQEQRAVAMRGRLILFSDELRKLQAQYQAAGDVVSAAAVQSELDSAAFAVKRLGIIARGQSEPPETGELKEDEKLSSAALAARRIDAIAAKFNQPRTDGPAVKKVLTGQMRPRILKIEKAAKNPGYSSYEGGSYWAYESSYAGWTLNDLAAGDYEIQLRYSASTESGGKALIKAAGQRFEITIPKGEKGVRKELTLTVPGVLKVKDPGVDVRVENGGIETKSGYLWNLHAVALMPTGKRP